MSMDDEVIAELEKQAGCVNADKLIYFADMINLAGDKWVETAPAKPDDMASVKIKAIAEKFAAEPELTFATVKKFNDFEIERRGIKTSVEEWNRRQKR